MGDKESGSVTHSLLIVDDRLDNLRLLSIMLGGEGYQVRTATNGAEALNAVQSASPDLILLDVMMPEMDGYEVCQRLKADATSRDIPIIFLSALSSTEDKLSAFELGGVDYITKPFQISEVLARVRNHLALRDLQKELEERNAELQERNAELQEALSTIKTLSGLIPICAWCGRRIQDETGEWMRVEAYLGARTDVKFTGGMCPECLVKQRAEVRKLSS